MASRARAKRAPGEPHEDPARQSARILRRRRSRHRHRRARHRACSARLSTCGTRSCTTCTWSSGCASSARCSSTSSTRCPTAPRVIFSAHGVPAAVENEAARRGLTVFDATCPLVTKVHMEVARYAREGRDVVLIGHAGHPEVEGTMGRFDTAQRRAHASRRERRAGARSSRCAIPSGWRSSRRPRCRWTTPRPSSMRCAQRFPGARQPAPRGHLLRHAESPGCREGAHRQLRRARSWSARSPAPIPTGCASSPSAPGGPATSSTMRRSCKREWFEGKNAVGVTAGASAPEELVQQVVARLREWGGSAGAGARRAARSTWCSRCRARCADAGARSDGAAPRQLYRQQSALRSIPVAIDREPPAVLVDAQLHAARIRRLSGRARRRARWPVAQAVGAVADRRSGRSRALDTGAMPRPSGAGAASWASSA